MRYSILLERPHVSRRKLSDANKNLFYSLCLLLPTTTCAVARRAIDIWLLSAVSTAEDTETQIQVHAFRSCRSNTRYCRSCCRLILTELPWFWPPALPWFWLRRRSCTSIESITELPWFWLPTVDYRGFGCLHCRDFEIRAAIAYRNTATAVKIVQYRSSASITFCF